MSDFTNLGALRAYVDVYERIFALFKEASGIKKHVWTDPVLNSRIELLQQELKSHHDGALKAGIELGCTPYEISDLLRKCEFSCTRLTGFEEKTRTVVYHAPLMSPKLDRLKDLLLHGEEPTQGREAKSDKSPPKWIRENFGQKQHTLLSKLWGGNEVPATDLINHLKYSESRNPIDSLRRRVSETNKGLTEKSNVIGCQWTIRQRTVENVLYFYLCTVAK